MDYDEIEREFKQNFGYPEDYPREKLVQEVKRQILNGTFPQFFQDRRKKSRIRLVK